MAIAVLCFVKVIGLVLLGPPRRSACAEAVEPPRRDAGRSSDSRRACVILGAVPGCSSARSAGSLRGRRPCPALGLHLPGTGTLPTLGFLVALRADCRLSSPRGRRAPRQLRPGRAANWSSRAAVDERRLQQAVPARARGGPAAAAGDRGTTRGGIVQEVACSGRVPHLIDTAVPPGVRRRCSRPRARRLQTAGSARTSSI